VSDTPTVLFACIHNSGRSVAAQKLAQRYAGDRVRVLSAGSEPGSGVNPAVAEVLAERGIGTDDHTPTLLDYDLVEGCDVVITMGCGETCPVFPGKRYEDWELTDPKGQPIDVVRGIVDDIDARVRTLLAELIPDLPIPPEGRVTSADQPRSEPRLSALEWPVRTERLVLRPATPADVSSTWEYRSLREFSEWTTRSPASLDEHTAHFTAPESLAKTLVVELGSRVIGDLMVSVQDGWAQTDVADQARGVQAELGWGLDPEHTGHGYATEAVQAMLRICFDGLRLRRVTASCFADNVPSWRLMERVGMRREEYAVRDSLHRSGAWLDGMTYALLADEWRARVATNDTSR